MIWCSYNAKWAAVFWDKFPFGVSVPCPIPKTVPACYVPTHVMGAPESFLTPITCWRHRPMYNRQRDVTGSADAALEIDDWHCSALRPPARQGSEPVTTDWPELASISGPVDVAGWTVNDNLVGASLMQCRRQCDSADSRRSRRQNNGVI